MIVGDNVDLRRDVRIEIVGDGRVSIGASSYLMLGAAIGCSANSVVTKPVPPCTLAAGAPARPIEYFGPDGEAPEELVLEHSR